MNELGGGLGFWECTERVEFIGGICEGNKMIFVRDRWDGRIEWVCSIYTYMW
ncbi:hypothetical protein Hanom_Chr03g00263881 [Helianthus anomalus]